MPPDTSIECLVKTAKLRWRIERDYQDLKQELEQRPMFRTCSNQKKQSEDNALRVAERLQINVRCFRLGPL